MKRRSLLAGILALGAAPAIVRASSLMVLPPARIDLPTTLAELPWTFHNLCREMVDGPWNFDPPTTGRWSSATPNLQELPRNWPISGAMVELRRQAEDRHNAARERMRLAGGADFAAIERRLIWQFD